MTALATGKLRLEGPVIVIQTDTDPGDVGEPRLLWDDDAKATVVFVPSFDLWRLAAVRTVLFEGDVPSPPVRRLGDMDPDPQPPVVADGTVGMRRGE